MPGISEPLTSRELEVLQLLAAGMPNQNIARELVVSLDTVKKHVGHVLGKLGAASRTEAVALARQLALIPSGAPLHGPRQTGFGVQAEHDVPQAQLGVHDFGADGRIDGQ